MVFLLVGGEVTNWSRNDWMLSKALQIYKAKVLSQGVAVLKI